MFCYIFTLVPTYYAWGVILLQLTAHSANAVRLFFYIYILAIFQKFELFTHERFWLVHIILEVIAPILQLQSKIQTAQHARAEAWV